ncbi:four-carbon acid sugar kinase family protein [Pseudomonas nabeulensis]|uniref:3-oxo-tetronate kinase n=1 Tax=Pseudomonas nabeulensis TaxID=2293833 RepID=A0A4Z0B2A9_9PSED|nr:3-oxo-tetronate kinase [Pseudomonas nabeulensis]TFY93156.1 four-carbon acid sugar kinase family protein [Pseudomonas nabeulensis]
MSAANPPLLGCIADDFTGATDLASILVRGGMRTVQTIGIPDAELADTLDADAVVIALKSRTSPAADAVRESLEALEWLRARGCRQFFFKYCSTFDSTPAGNIGPVTDALLQALGSDFTIACPAFPENGRTLYRGHLFVQDGLLSESGMEHHPLTPMKDANLVRVLSQQTPSPVGLVRYDAVAQGAEAVLARFDELRTEGVRIAIADALSDADLITLGEACAALPLVTGGSGIAQGLPANFLRQGTLRQLDAAHMDTVDGRAVVLAGSASKATNAQVAEWLQAGNAAFHIDPLALADGQDVVGQAVAYAQAHEPALIYSTSSPQAVRAAQEKLGVERAGALVEEALGNIARRLFDTGFRHFVVAGGETSGSVVKALNVKALRIGRMIDPGVPLTLSLGSDESLSLTLKSGNFGSQDFFIKALRFMQGATA